MTVVISVVTTIGFIQNIGIFPYSVAENKFSLFGTDILSALNTNPVLRNMSSGKRRKYKERRILGF
jgi:hypothetical protein